MGRENIREQVEEKIVEAGDLTTTEHTPLLAASKPLFKRRLKLTKGRQALMLSACIYLHFMTLGFTVVLGVVYVELIRVFKAPRSEAAVMQSAYQGLVYIGGIVFSKLVMKFGVGASVMVASFIGGLSMLGSAFSVNIYMIIALVGVVGGLAMSVNYLSGFVAVGWTFETNRRAAVSLLTAATALGQTILPYVSDYLISKYSWTGLFIISAGIMLQGIPCGLILYFSEPYFYKGEDCSTDNVQLCQLTTKKGVTFIFFALVCSVFNGAASVESWFIVDLSVLRGFTRNAGTLLLCIVGALSLGGRLLGAIILKVNPSIRIAVPMAISFTVLGASHMIVIAFTSYYGMMVGVMLRGLALGLIMASIQPMQLELCGLEAFPKSVAVCNVLIGCGLVVCGYIWGYLEDLTGNYELVFQIATGLAAANALTMIIIRCLQ